MPPVNLKSLVGRFDEYCAKTVEGAVALCVARKHYNVEVEHWLLKLLEEPGTDLDRIFDHFEESIAARVQRELSRALERFKTGNSRPPALSPFCRGSGARGVAGRIARVQCRAACAVATCCSRLIGTDPTPAASERQLG